MLGCHAHHQSVDVSLDAGCPDNGDPPSIPPLARQVVIDLRFREAWRVSAEPK